MIYSQENLQNLLQVCDFAAAMKLIAAADFEQVRNDLYVIAYDTENFLPYVFASYLIQQKEQGEYHHLASHILTFALNHLPGAYQAGLYHARRAVELSDGELAYREALLYYYDLPEQLLKEEEALQIAREILAEEPENEVARQVLGQVKL